MHQEGDSVSVEGAGLDLCVPWRSVSYRNDCLIGTSASKRSLPMKVSGSEHFASDRHSLKTSLCLPDMASPLEIYASQRYIDSCLPCRLN